ncbi:glutamate-1-semialdehyde 2,1-aminomutase [Salipiger sp. CCB-MM3]|uniref:aminotransferase class III-fold pyridoxal phosphate-dependent enzyme n=1 Tax=Salipiger sp. CCB-MM3 TaxID=1792508 RepID=UPI00080AAF48|nr:aminotransferase class III-fold pyridoxal phosphate-dependent enzyme [Salipiger sp. CCB-MM3]ANT62207.1 glutamate-1-semialdehyde 2,1-aminomutase [Salipiger sp. CCB-MM3]
MRSSAEDRALRERAEKVIPGGMYGHLSARMMPEGFPQFFAGGKGTRLTDVDGNIYIDFMCAYGPNLLGYRDPQVEAAVAAQLALGDTLTGPGPAMVELAEAMVSMVSHADWAMFCKNGGDATMMALMTARAYRGKRKVLVARNAYHGAMPWNTPKPAGVLAEDRAHVIYYDYNDAQALEDAVKQADGDLAGIFASPFRHDTFARQAPVDPEYARAARRLADDYDALLIVDDVRAGLRVARDCSWSEVGVQPDLSSWGKVLGNGQPISALMGNDRAREASAKLYVTGSFWYSAVPMVAALETLRIVRETDYLERMQHVGTLFRDGLQAQSAAAGMPLTLTGPVTMPILMFDEDPDFRLGYAFCREAMLRGIYLSPFHNMFMNAAMTPADIAEVLSATADSFEALKTNRDSITPAPAVLALMGD